MKSLNLTINIVNDIHSQVWIKSGGKSLWERHPADWPLHSFHSIGNLIIYICLSPHITCFQIWWNYRNYYCSNRTTNQWKIGELMSAYMYQHRVTEYNSGQLTCGPSSGPFFAGRPCRSSVWLELQQWEAGPFTMPCKEWFSWASLSTRALASWKRQLRNSRSSLVLRCHPSISSQRWRKARLLRRKASGRQKDKGKRTGGRSIMSYRASHRNYFLDIL